MKKLNYWIWLHDCLHPRTNVAKLFSEYYKGPQEIFEDKKRALCPLFTPKTLERMNRLSPEESYRRLEACSGAGIDLLTPEDKEYPALLLETEDYPVLLYAKGDLSVLHGRLPFAIVGTRNPGLRGKQAASLLAERLSECHFLICSGGALGIDSAAHLGALHSGAPTVAVLGGGFHSRYLQANRDLREVIAAKGLLLSETDPWEEPGRGTFPNRNRIIAGMTVGTLVIEAHRKSGSLLTARDATRYNREVMAVPGEHLGTAYLGAEDLLADGAAAVRCPMDVISALRASYGAGALLPKEREEALFLDVLEETNWTPLPSVQTEKQEVAAKQKKPLREEVTPDAAALYACFCGQPLSVEQLAKQTGMPVNRLLGALTELELLGYVSLQPDSKYNLKQDG